MEATRYTETGFVGENTSNMIKGLMDNAVRMERELAKKRVAKEAREKAEAKVLELLKLPKGSEDNRARLRRGEFDHLTVRVAPREKPAGGTGNPLSGAFACVLYVCMCVCGSVATYLELTTMVCPCHHPPKSNNQTCWMGWTWVTSATWGRGSSSSRRGRPRVPAGGGWAGARSGRCVCCVVVICRV